MSPATGSIRHTFAQTDGPDRPSSALVRFPTHGSREPAAPANEASGRPGLASPSGRAGDRRRQLGATSSSSAVPPKCPKHRSPEVIHGQPRFMPMPADLQDQATPSGPRELPKLAVGRPGRPPPGRQRPERLGQQRAATAISYPARQLTDRARQAPGHRPIRSRTEKATLSSTRTRQPEGLPTHRCGVVPLNSLVDEA
jgi:hypothetical protein